MSMLNDRRSWMRLLALCVVALIAVGAVAACGDDGDDATTTEMTVDEATTPATDTEAPATAEGTVLEIPSAEGLAYEVTEVSAPAGEITLRSPNPHSVPHNIAIDAPDPVVGEVVTDGGVSEITVTLEPGTYEYYCSVPGHREGGMVGTLTVE